MITTETIMEQMTGKEIVDALTKVMAEKFEDFPAVQQRYHDAIRTIPDQPSGPSAAEVADAIQKQTASNLLFSGLLGLKANLDNFVNPVTRNFLDVDSETYLRENTARRLPEYTEGQQVLDRFFAGLSPEQKSVGDDIIAYICHLETAGPKLAHFYGYLLGNELLYRIIPGYHADAALTIRYRMLMQQHFYDSV